MESCNEPLQIFLCNGKVLVWNGNDAANLREQYRIVGNLVGCLARFPRQNNVLGLPLQLMPEEASLLIDKGYARLTNGSLPLEQPTSQQVEDYHKWQEENYQEQVELFREERKAEITQNLPRIIEGKKNKRIKLLNKKKDDVDDVDEQDKEESTTIDVDSMNIPAVPRTSSLVQLFTECPWKSEQSGKVPDWTFPNTPKERIRNLVFQDLWSKGHYITSGTKFGGDYLVYPGDPARFHSHFIAICLEHKKNLSALDVVAMGRLGSNVRKTVVLCSVDDQEQICYTSLQWTAIS